MRLALYEWYVCKTRPGYYNHLVAQEAQAWASAHGIHSIAESCLRCGRYHIYWDDKPLDQRRVFWFAVSMAIFLFMSLGAWICKGDLGFVLWILGAFAVACLATCWQYGKLQ